jgi:predicted methyltransferase
MLGFIGVGPGAKVADLAAGEGYTTELLARTVGPAGVVYAQNPPSLLEKFPGVAIALAARLARPSCKNVVRVDRELDAPLPPEAHDLDAVVMNLFYHDTYWLGTDRRKMNAAILAALRPGGVFVVIDHSAKPGAGSTVVSSLHRVDEKLVRDEITAAGFALGSESSFLRNPSDTRDWIVFDEKRRGTTDRFALKFVQPR